MRIGVLTTSYPREEGDPAGEFVAGFTRWLSARAEVEVLCADAGRRLFYRGGAPLALSNAKRWPEALGFSARLLLTASARARRWDGLVSHWLVPSAAIAALVGRRKPHLAIAHGSDIRLLRRLPGGEALVRQIARVADLVYVADHLRVDGAPGRVVPMGVEAASWRDGDREGTRRALGLDKFTLLFLGRLIHDKGADRAIAALPDGVELLVAGEGPERANLEAQARGKAVRFLGEVRGEAKRDLLAAADALVVTSRVDGAPTVLAEAAAAGLPVITELSQRPIRQSPSAQMDWSVIGPKLAGGLVAEGGGRGNVQMTRV